MTFRKRCKVPGRKEAEYPAIFCRLSRSSFSLVSERGTQAGQPQNQHILMESTHHMADAVFTHLNNETLFLNLLTQSPNRIKSETTLLYSHYLSELKLEAVTMTSSLL